MRWPDLPHAGDPVPPEFWTENQDLQMPRSIEDLLPWRDFDRGRYWGF